MMLAHLRRMARYNHWANARLYAACAELPAAEYHKPRPAFFGSIHGTLNHLIVADRLWLARIVGDPPPPWRLDDQPFADLPSLHEARRAEDARMVDILADAEEADLARDVVYRMVSLPQVEMRTPWYLCWLHAFNHQTHHRGQAHDQLSQTTVTPPPLDLILYLRETGEE
jgi:uncharacterized damage-inducible protein DinB